MFQLNDIELAGISAELLSSLIVPDILEENDPEKMIVFAKSFLSVQSPSEIYGFSTFLYDLCSNVQIFSTEQQIIIQGIQYHLSTKGNEIASFIKNTMIKILETQIDSSLEEPTLQVILQILFQSLGDIELHSEIFSCFSKIIENFPLCINSIFQSVVPIAIQSFIQNQNNQQSIIYFFESLISNETIQHYQKVIPIILPSLLNIIKSEVDEFKSDASNFFESILHIYEGNILQLINSQPNKSNLSILIAFCVMIKLKKNEVNFPFIFSMISSQNDREKFMAIRCVKKLAKSGVANEQLIAESLKHFNKAVPAIRFEIIGLIGELSIYPNFFIENYFESLLNFYISDDPYLRDVSYNALKKIIKSSPTEKVTLLVPAILSLFAQFLSAPQLYENLISLSTLIQTISFQIGEKYSPFAQTSLSLLQKMSLIDLDFMIHAFTPIAAIARSTRVLPFIDSYLAAMLGALKSFRAEEVANEDYAELAASMIDAVVDSFSFIMQAFDVRPVILDFFNTYLAIFEITHFRKFVTGFNDILIKYPELVATVSPRLLPLLLSAASEFASYINGDDGGCEGEIEGEIEDEIQHVVLFANDLLSLVRIVVEGSQIVNPQLAAFAFAVTAACARFVGVSDEAKFVVLDLVRAMAARLPSETYSFLQGDEAVKAVVLFGLNDEEFHAMAQSIIDTYGAESF